MPISRRITPRLRAAALAAGCLIVMACATGGRGGAAADASGQHVLSSAQLANTAARSVHEAIRILRPELLTGRGRGEPDLYVDGRREPTGVQRLKEIAVSAVETVEYLRVEQARSRFPDGQSQGGALVVTLR